MATSTAQTIPLVEVYDYYLAPGDPATGTTSAGKRGRTVKVTLQYDRGLTIAPDSVVWVAQEAVYTALTDLNGFWHVFLVPNNKISPANTYYTVEIEGGPSYKIQVTDVGVPGPGWQSSASGILLDIPAALAPTTSTVGAITATGLITAQAGINITAGGLTVTGGETETGGLTVDTLAFSTPASQIQPGSTSFSVRNHANNADNLLVTDAGNVTVRGSLTVTGGGFTVSAGGAAITGNSTVTGTLTTSGGLTVQAGGAAITGASSIAGNTTIAGALTVTSTVNAQGGLLASSLDMRGAAAAAILGGTVSFGITNNANSAYNLLIADAGLITLRNALQFPPAAAGTIAPTGYASTWVKIAEAAGTGASGVITLSGIPTNFRSLRLRIYGQADNAATFDDCRLTINNDTGTNYDWALLNANGGSGTWTPSQGNGVAFLRLGEVPGTSNPAHNASNIVAEISFANDANLDKSVISESNFVNGSYAANNINVTKMTGYWHNATPAAITRLDLTLSAGNWKTSSIVILEGEP